MPPIAAPDMSNIRSALMSRVGVGVPPATDQSAILNQMSQPTGQLPTGGVNTPMPVAPGVPTPQTPPAGPAAPPQGPATPGQDAAKLGMLAQNPNFDPQTRDIAKTLVAKLLKVI